MESPFTHVKRFFVGILVGIASMLPGVSGGVMAVCFGIYERAVSDLADITRKIKSDFPFLLTVGLGIIAGMGVSAFGLKAMMTEYLAISLFLFLGLILGQMPELYKFTEPESGSLNLRHWAAFAAGFAIMIGVMFLGEGRTVAVDHSLVSLALLIFVGMVIALSKIVPGLSGSAFLLAMGLYYPLLNALTSFDILIVSAVLIGFAAGVLGLAKAMNYALTKYRRITYFSILGFTVGSIAIIIKEIYLDVASSADIIGGFAALAVGLAVSILFSRAGNNSSEKSNDKKT